MKNFATSILIVICLSQGKTQFIIIELLREVIRRKLLLLKHRQGCYGASVTNLATGDKMVAITILPGLHPQFTLLVFTEFLHFSA